MCLLEYRRACDGQGNETSFHIGREGVCASTKDGSLGKEGNGSFQIGREESARTMDGTLVGGDFFGLCLCG